MNNKIIRATHNNQVKQDLVLKDIMLDRIYNDILRIKKSELSDDLKNYYQEYLIDIANYYVNSYIELCRDGKIRPYLKETVFPDVKIDITKRLNKIENLFYSLNINEIKDEFAKLSDEFKIKK